MTRAPTVLFLLALAGCAHQPATNAPAEHAYYQDVGFAPSDRFMSMRINVDLDGVDLADCMEQISRQVGKDIVVDPAVKETVTISLRDLPWREAVDIIAEQASCVTEDGPDGVIVRYR